MDINGDGKVDGADVAQLQAAWGAYTMARNVPVPVVAPVTAPVNAPWAWPNNSLSISVSGSAAQFTFTKGLLFLNFQITKKYLVFYNLPE